MVKQRGGRVDVYSESGAGCTFKVYLPRAAQEVVKPRPSAVREVPRTGAETILLVEDEDGVRMLARLVLERQGYKGLETRNGGGGAGAVAAGDAPPPPRVAAGGAGA